MRILICFLAALAAANAQTRILNVNIQNLGSVDSSIATATKPFRLVASDQAGACLVASELVFNSVNGKIYGCVGGTWQLISNPGSGVAIWGAITGTLASQGDLATALSARLVAASNLSDVANAATARTNLGLAIGSNVSAWDADLDAIAALSRARGDLIVGGASAWVRLPIGASARYLRSDGTDPAWTQINYSDITGTLPAHNHTTAEITSGVFGLTRGGTNQFSWTASRCVQVSADGLSLESAAAACGVGGGIASLGGLTGSTQTFANDTNLTISSAGTTHTLVWAGTLAKARQHAATVYNDAANTWSTGAQDFAAATSLKVPTSAGATPGALGLIAYDSTANTYKGHNGSATKTFAYTDSNITGNAANITGVAGAANGGTGDDTSASTGVPRIASGNWTYDAGVSHLASSTSAELAAVLSDETGTAGGFVRATTSATVGQVLRVGAGPTIGFGAVDLADADAVTGSLPGTQVSNTPAGGIAATTAQAAINELDTEKQPLDSDLTAVAGLASNGIPVRTGAGAFAVRSIVGTAGVTCTDGDGVNGNPTCTADTTEMLSRATGQGGADNHAVSASASATTYTATLPFTPAALTDGMRLVWEPDVACTGNTATTLNANSLGAKRIYRHNGDDPLPADCTANKKLELVYDGALTAGAGGWEIKSVTPAIASLTAAVNAQTGTSYTLVAADNGKVLTFNNASDITLTVPTGLGAGFNCLIVQLGAGEVVPTASSTTINVRGSVTKTGGQYAVATIVAYAANTFVLGGDLQ